MNTGGGWLHSVYWQFQDSQKGFSFTEIHIIFSVIHNDIYCCWVTDLKM